MKLKTTIGLCFTVAFFVLAMAVNLLNPAFESPKGTSPTVHVMRLLSTVLATAAVALFWQISNFIFPNKTEAAELDVAIIRE